MNLAKLNIAEEIGIDVVERKMKELGKQLELESDRYEKVVFKLDQFINRLGKEISKEEGIDF